MLFRSLFLVFVPVPAGAVVALAAALLVVVGRWRAALVMTSVAAAAAAGTLLPLYERGASGEVRKRPLRAKLSI